jgi:hypothetical protein
VWSYTSTLLACTETTLRLINAEEVRLETECILEHAEVCVRARVVHYSGVGQFREVVGFLGNEV